MSTIYTEGDLVEAVKGEERHRGRVRIYAQRSYIGSIGGSIDVYEDDGWTLTVIEAATVVLPAEPGAYIDTVGEPCIAGTDGYGDIQIWYAGANFPRSHPDRYAPFTRLEPVPVTAKAVLDRVASWWEFGPPPVFTVELAQIATEFGVTE